MRVSVEHRLGPVDEVPIGEGRAYAAGGVPVAVFRTRAGGLYALGAVCPHAGGPIADGLIDESVVVCPLHQYAYALRTGESTSDQPALPCYPVRIDDAGHLVIEVPAE